MAQMAYIRSRSRIIPLGGRNDPINQKGLDYYSNLVDALLAADIVPMLTLFHWDLPDALDKRYGGLLNKDEFVADYTHYARTVFAAMGSRVKYWITFNEPWCSSILGYSTGLFAPGYTSDRAKSAVGDSSTEPWVVGHNLLVAHGSAVKVYREEFKARDGGQIGITLNGACDLTFPRPLLFAILSLATANLISISNLLASISSTDWNQATGPNPTSPPPPPTSPPASASSNSASPGSATQSTTAATLPP